MSYASIDAVDAAKRPRIAIEAVTPTVDGGRFPVKTIAGRPIEVVGAYEAEERVG